MATQPTGAAKKKPDCGAGVMHKKGYGPICLGTDHDQHEIGRTADKEPIQSAHIQTGAYFWGKDKFDAPLDFQFREYPRPPALPYKSRVHLVMDSTSGHKGPGGQNQGMWKWYAEYAMQEAPSHPIPTTPEPPRKGPPPVVTPEDPPQRPGGETTPGDPPPPANTTQNGAPTIPTLPQYTDPNAPAIDTRGAGGDAPRVDPGGPKPYPGVVGHVHG